MFFSNIPVSGADSQKRLRLHLDFKKLPLDTHIKIILTKVNNTIGLLIRKCEQVLPRPSLITI